MQMSDHLLAIRLFQLFQPLIHIAKAIVEQLKQVVEEALGNVVELVRNLRNHLVQLRTNGTRRQRKEAWKWLHLFSTSARRRKQRKRRALSRLPAYPAVYSASN